MVLSEASCHRVSWMSPLGGTSCALFELQELVLIELQSLLTDWDGALGCVQALLRTQNLDEPRN